MISVTEPVFHFCIRYCNQSGIRVFVVGKGSNCLFDDRGFDGCVILNRIEYVSALGGGVYEAGGGYPFNQLGIQCSKEGYTGLEFAAGIPGTVGGAVYMNAGADGQVSWPQLDFLHIHTRNLSSCSIVCSCRFIIRMK